MMKKIDFKKFKGLLLAISVVVGSVIGTGIFFKNNSMIAWAHGNGFLVLGAWIFGTIIAFCAALAFSQIARKTKKSNTGIGQLSEEMIGKKMGWHTKINWAFFYFPWNSLLIALYASDYIMQITTGSGAGGSQYSTLITIGIASFLVCSFFLMHTLWKNIGNWFQISTTIIKVMPLIILAIGAMVVVFILPEHNWWGDNSSPISPYDPTLANDTSGMSPILILLFIVPGTLFAYDSFINATNVSESVSKKQVTYAIVGGMTFIAIIYLLVTVAIISTGTLNAEDALVRLFGGNPANLSSGFIVMTKIIQIFILISALGGANGFALVWTNSIRAMLKKNTNKNTFIAGSIGLLVIGLPLIIITVMLYITNYVPDGLSPKSAGRHIGISFADALSNPLIIISYSVYAFTLLFAIWRNWKIKNKTEKYAWWFTATAIIAAIMILMILGYILFYSVLYKAFANGGGTFGGVPGWLFLIFVTWYLTIWFILPFMIKKIMPSLIIKPGQVETKINVTS